MSLKTALMLLATFLPEGAGSQSEQALVLQANAAFAEGKRLRDNAEKARPYFRQAAELMEELRRLGVNNPLFYRNLGQAYLLADDLPRAILTYRHGLRLSPGDRDLLRCLNEARELVIYPGGSSLGRPGPDNQPPWLPGVRPAWFLGALVLLYLAAWMALTRWFMLRRPVHLVLGLMAFLGAGGLALVLLDVVKRERGEVEAPVVVIAEDGVQLRRGNNLNFPPRWEMPVNKGVEARLLFQRGNFLQIQLAGGEIGWVPGKIVLVDEH